MPQKKASLDVWGCLTFQENSSFGHQKVLNWASHNLKDMYIERARFSTIFQQIHSFVSYEWLQRQIFKNLFIDPIWPPQSSQMGANRGQFMFFILF